MKKRIFWFLRNVFEGFFNVPGTYGELKLTEKELSQMYSRVLAEYRGEHVCKSPREIYQNKPFKWLAYKFRKGLQPPPY